MLKVLNARQMQGCDAAAIEEYRIPGILLMENAGVQVVEAVIDRFDGDPPLSTAILCGKGNNGGDGFVVARHLHNLGREVVVYLFGTADELSDDAGVNHRIAAAMDVPVVEVPDDERWAEMAGALGDFDCIVDAMLGTGIDSAARGPIAAAIESVNRAGVPVVAVDLPSGLSADRSVPPGVAVRADATVTFAALKPCHVLHPASAHCGDVSVADIGIPQRVLAESGSTLSLVTPDDVAGILPARPADGHKGSFGKVLVVAGSRGTTGAAVLTARAAARAGAGLVTVACPESVYDVVGAQLTEALVHPVAADADGGLGAGAGDALQELVDRSDVVALGPGIGTGADAVELVRRLVREVERPMVVDADGLNALAGHLEELREAAGPRVLTPHPGEASRLLERGIDEIQEDRPAAVRDLVDRSGAVVLLKGHRTLVAAPTDRSSLGGVPLVNPTGNPGMASGGTGDVLTGLVAALLGLGLDPERAAWVGAWLHGDAGDRAAARTGEDALVAGDLVAELPEALQVLRGSAGGPG